jgi:glycosyltransferase involved in cell wall biosynthesis
MFIFNSVDGGASARRISPCLDLVIAESLDAIDSIGAMRFDGPPARLIPSAVPPSPMRSDRPPGSRMNVGFIGRLTPDKYPEAIPSIAERLPHEGFRYLIAGDGPLRPSMERIVTRLGSKREIRFFGHLSDRALDDVFSGLDVLVVPSLIDGRPLVIQEAHWRGVVVVASRTGGIPELVSHEETGLLCRPGDIADFARQIGRLAENGSLRRRMAIAARRKAEQEETMDSRLSRYVSAITGSDAQSSCESSS